MTQRLETLEDFERVAKALQNPNAKPHEYQVKSFGYCLHCNSEAQYESEASSEWLMEKCLKCGFGLSGPMGGFRSFILTDDNVPVRHKVSIDAMHSRAEQKKFFDDAIRARTLKFAEEATEHERKFLGARASAIALSELRHRAKQSK